MRCLISIALLLVLCGCADLGYYWHNARGHLDLMNRRVDIEDLLADKTVAPEIQQRLGLVQQIRRFSIERLRLPDNDSYLSYVELDRPYVVQNLFAAAEFSTNLHQWCYPIIGCASYRGYFDEKLMLDYAEELSARGLEVHIGKVSAYSTLGWFDDPVLSSFIHWPDHRLAGLIFHELTHQRIYIDDDTTFNESLATAVQQVGTELWLKSGSRHDQFKTQSRWQSYRDEVIALITDTRASLTEIYSRDIDANRKRELKKQAFAQARAAHRVIADKYAITAGFTGWFAADLNNAKIGSVAAYHSAVPAFVNMLKAKDLNFVVFFDYVEQLGRLEKPLRDGCLAAWKRHAEPPASACPEFD